MFLLRTNNVKMTKKDKQTEIIKKYKEYWLDQGESPKSVYQFAKTLEMQESIFYEYFNSFTALDKSIWLTYFKDTHNRLEAEDKFEEFSSREKLLAFYFTLFEELVKDRSYLLLRYPEVKMPAKQVLVLEDFKMSFKDFIKIIVAEAYQTEEVKERPYLSSKYDEALWLQCLFLLNFWIKDDSKGFEKTDAAIEKAVNLSFELMGKSTLDSIFDFGKFLYQNKSWASRSV